MENANPTKKISKRFFSSVNECRWLNSLGKDGYRLLYRTENAYTFELTDETLYYSVEWLDCSPESEEGVGLIEARTAEGASLAATYSLWAYFVSTEPIALSEATQKRNAIRYRNTAFIFFALDFIASILIAYQFAVRSFLEKQELFLSAPEYEKGSNIILNIAKRILYGGEVLLHRYANLFTGWFGNTKATAVLSILIPLAIIFAVLGAVWTNEWLKNLPEKSTEEEPEDDGQRA
ncbi:MAG: hypothetical protein IKV50_04630 [Clostridia bacterium]|nr:hypothetical protein [Clostridia bacterium]